MPPVPGWDDDPVRPQKFRYNPAITVAAVVAFFGAVPLASSRAYLLPIALVPILIAVWGWRAGTDVGPAGLRVRALLGSRLVPWSHVAALMPADRRRVYAVLTTGRKVRLPAVGAAELATFPDTAAEKPAPTDQTASTDQTAATDETAATDRTTAPREINEPGGNEEPRRSGAAGETAQ
jgi:hypothetical protein